MRYGLRTLLILLAIGPAAIGFTALVAPRRPFTAALILLWTTAFFLSESSANWLRTRLGLTSTEWLALAAIAACVIGLCLPTDPCFYGGCRE